MAFRRKGRAWSQMGWRKNGKGVEAERLEAKISEWVAVDLGVALRKG